MIDKSAHKKHWKDILYHFSTECDNLINLYIDANTNNLLKC